MISGHDILASGVVFDPAPVDISANDALAASEATAGSEGHTRIDEATDFLRDLLAGGPLEVLDVEIQARKAGLLGDGKPLRQSKTFREARETLGVVSEREGFGKGARYVLRLPDTPCASENIMCALPQGRGAHGD
jgi:hypothetical protein